MSALLLDCLKSSSALSAWCANLAAMCPVMAGLLMILQSRQCAPSLAQLWVHLRAGGRCGCCSTHRCRGAGWLEHTKILPWCKSAQAGPLWVLQYIVTIPGNAQCQRSTPWGCCRSQEGRPGVVGLPICPHVDQAAVPAAGLLTCKPCMMHIRCQKHTPCGCCSIRRGRPGMLHSPCSLHGEQSTTLVPCDCCRTLRCRPYMMPTSRR